MKPELIHQEDWKRGADEALMDLIVFRVPGGILYEIYTNGDRCLHQFSPRPYVLGQPCDGTIEHCVFALFYDYCGAKGLDPAALYREAYSDCEPDSKGERDATTRRAMAEGVAFPLAWDNEAYRGLLESLTEINNHSLVSVLTERAGP